MKVTDEAVEAMLLSWFGMDYGGNHMEEGRAALRAALPHLSQGADKKVFEFGGRVYFYEKRDDRPWGDYWKFVGSEPAALSPAPVGVTDTDAELIAALRSEIPFALFNGTEADWDEAERKLQAAADRFEALASHEPAQPKVGIIAHDDHGKANLSAHVARALAAFIDTQEGVSEAGEWRDEAAEALIDEPRRTENEALPSGPDASDIFGYWCKHKYADGCLLKPQCYIPEPSDDMEVIPLVRQSALQQEVERLKADLHASTVISCAHCRNWRAEQARNAELVKALEELCSYSDEEYVPNAAFAKARAVLEGQSNE